MKKKYRLTVIAAVVTLLCTGCRGLEEDSFEKFIHSTADKKQAEGRESVSEGRYAYEQLTEEEQIVYDEVQAAIMEHAASVVVSTTDRTVLHKAYDYVRADYGGLFWVDGYTYVESNWLGQIMSLEFLPSYTMTRYERDEIQASIDERVEQLLGGISDEDSDYQKARFVYDTIINTVTYDSGAENNQNIISVFGRENCLSGIFQCNTVSDGESRYSVCNYNRRSGRRETFVESYYAGWRILLYGCNMGRFFA